MFAALLRLNPRVLSPGIDCVGLAEWREADAAPQAPSFGGAINTDVLDHLVPLIVKVEQLEPAETAALLRAQGSGIRCQVLTGNGERSSVLLAGSRGAVRDLVAALAHDGCAEMSAALTHTLEAFERRSFDLAVGGHPLRLDGRPLLMGVVNVTPDSFSDGGLFFDRQAALAQGLALKAAGADLIDVGGESTRPGAAAVNADEELARVLPVVEGLSAAGAGPVSIDTSKADVARRCVEAGAAMLNDVTALFGDERMAGTVADLGVPVCVMHMQGTPRTMQVRPHYDDLMGEIILFLRRSMARGVAAGISEDRFLVDPGVGFGKTVRHNLVILHRLAQLRSLGRPILVGTSRKSFIGKVLADESGDRPVGKRLMGTAGSVAAAILGGAHVLRVHDVGEMRDVALVLEAIENEAVNGIS